MCNFDFADKLEANADYSSLADNSWTIRSAIWLDRQKNPVRANPLLVPQPVPVLSLLCVHGS